MNSSSNEIFLQLAIVLGLSALLGFSIRIFRLPLIIAYLITGVALAYFKIFDPAASQVLTFLPGIGMAFVLFFVGMELDFAEIKSLGRPIVVAGLTQIALAISTGFLIATYLKYPASESIFLGFGLAFSSTIVVVKLLLEKKDLSSLYGKLSLGILLLEDLVAILLLMVMSVGNSVFNLGLQNSLPLLALMTKGAILLILTFGLSRYVLSGIFKAVAHSSELLFLSALAWCFIFIAAGLFLGFSVIIGAFLAGIALANSPFHFEIQGKVKPLRDFFVTLFFVYLGSQVVFSQIRQVLPLIALFTLYATFLKPIIFLLILGVFGFRKHTIFQTALNLSQISEFSLIVMLLGIKLGVVSSSSLTAVALTGVISIIISSIMISYSRQIYLYLSPIISFFEHQGFTHQVEIKDKKENLADHAVLIGAHRIGGQIINFLKSQKIPLLVVDFNPRTIQKLSEEKITALYGDIGDPEIFEFLNLEKAKLVISTASDLDDNLMLLSEIKRRRIKTVVIVRANSVADANTLYQAGASYVILPETISGDFITQTLKTHWPSLDFFKDRSEIELGRLSKNHLALE